VARYAKSIVPPNAVRPRYTKLVMRNVLEACGRARWKWEKARKPGARKSVPVSGHKNYCAPLWTAANLRWADLTLLIPVRAWFYFATVRRMKQAAPHNNQLFFTNAASAAQVLQ